MWAEVDVSSGQMRGQVAIGWDGEIRFFGA